MDANKEVASPAYTAGYEYILKVGEELSKVPVDKETGKCDEKKLIEVFRKTAKLRDEPLKPEEFTGKVTKELRSELRSRLLAVTDSMNNALRLNGDQINDVMDKGNKGKAAQDFMNALNERIDDICNVILKEGDDVGDDEPGKKIDQHDRIPELDKGIQAGGAILKRKMKKAQADAKYAGLVDKALGKKANKNV